jgi:glycerol-3-phosphate cytidylyltransferase-like family protein
MLATIIRSSETIHGFEIGIKKEINIILHGDDSTSSLKDVQSEKQVIKTVEQVSRVAGTNLNVKKSEYILLGSLQNTCEKIEYVLTNQLKHLVYT